MPEVITVTINHTLVNKCTRYDSTNSLTYKSTPSKSSQFNVCTSGIFNRIYGHNIFHFRTIYLWCTNIYYRLLGSGNCSQTTNDNSIPGIRFRYPYNYHFQMNIYGGFLGQKQSMPNNNNMPSPKELSFENQCAQSGRRLTFVLYGMLLLALSNQHTTLVAPRRWKFDGDRKSPFPALSLKYTLPAAIDDSDLRRRRHIYQW